MTPQSCGCLRVLDDAGFCPECGVRPAQCTCALQFRDPDALDITVAAFEACVTFDDVAELMRLARPPTTKVLQIALRAKLCAVLKDKEVPTPAKWVDAWYEDSTSVSTDAGKGTPVTFEDPEPWPDPVNGVELLDEIVKWITTYVTATSWDIDTIVLYAAFTHAYDLFDICPHLFVTSPTKRCGKTTVLRLVQRLVPRPLLASNISTASIYRVIEDHRPSLLVDEADTFLAEDGEVHGILNAGHTRESAYVIRQVGPDRDDTRKFSTWTPKIVAAIGSLRETFEDRAIRISLKRRARDERVGRARSRVIKAEGEVLHARLARWVADHQYELATYDTELMHLNERAEDNWLGLFAVAAAAGGDWPARALAASKAIAAEDQEATVGEQLLMALPALFDAQPDPGFLPSRELIDGLAAMEGGPWQSMWSKDLVEAARSTDEEIHRQIYSRLGARVFRDLRPFNVPKTEVVGSTRGYKREWFESLWRAYGHHPGEDVALDAAEGVEGVGAVENIGVPLAHLATPSTPETAIRDAHPSLLDMDGQGAVNRRYETGSMER
jgi:hypothetical protein